MLKHKLYLRTSRTNKSGKSALYFLINTKPQSWIATGIFINENDWNQKRQLLLASCPDYYQVSAQITLQKSKADLYMLSLQYEGRKFSIETFTAAVITGDLDQVFNPTVRQLITDYKNNNRLSPGREKHYDILDKELTELRPGTRIKEVDNIFAMAYEKYCLQKGNCKNTTSAKMRRLKAIVHYAQLKKIIKEDPLQNYKIRSYRSNRVALTTNELSRLQALADAPGNMETKFIEPLKCFLFMCYTGLRYSDLRSLKRSEIKNGYIRIDMHKTGLPVSIPVIPAADQLIQIRPDGKCFKVLANEPFNRYLKDIGKHAGLGKELSTRVARHTFATISIGLGIPLKVISEILGHTTVKTTEIYTSVYDEMKSQEMKKWQLLTVAYVAGSAQPLADGTNAVAAG